MNSLNISNAVDVLTNVPDTMEARAQGVNAIAHALVSCFPRVAALSLKDLTLKAPNTGEFSGRIWPVFVNSTRTCFQLFRALTLPVSPSPEYTLELLARAWRCVTPQVLEHFTPMGTGGLVRVSYAHYTKHLLGPLNRLAKVTIISESERRLMIDVLRNGVLPCFAGQGDSMPDRLVSSTIALTFAACGLRANRDKIEKGVEIIGQASEVLAATVGQLHPVLEAMILEGIQDEIDQIARELQTTSMNKQNFDREAQMLSQYKKFQDFVNTKPKFKEKKTEKFISHYENTDADLNLDALYNAVTGENTSGDPMLETVLATEQRSRRAVEDFCVRLKKLFVVGIIAVMGHSALKEGVVGEEMVRKTFGNRERIFFFKWLARKKCHGSGGANWFDILTKSKVKVVLSFCVDPKPIKKSQIQEKIESQKMKGGMMAVALALNKSFPTAWSMLSAIGGSGDQQLP
ncbi:hypothetical protein FQN60_008548 [Etheostoma spectabile]|uniref:Uncharacterized protein n=1 Tax=Etheostoma spectabile TaxID=54343 RepID=A0A5J5CAG2_9PERO|nr:hypothetical protein FQN60_008548 [Etheostoma spectabile]